MPLLSKLLNGNNMRLIKLGLISFVVLFLLATAIGLLFPSTVLVSRAIDIKSSKATVFENVKDLRKWNNWVDGMNNPIVKLLDSSEAKLGNTTVKIVAITDTTVVSEWISENAAKQTSTIRLIGDSSTKMTVVQWQFVQEVKWYPWERFSSMMNDRIIGTLLEKNLNQLKKTVEEQ
jgi:hypothetical protein